MKQRYLSLRTLLILPFVLQVVGVTALVGYLSYRSGRQAVETLANQLMEETGTLVTHDLDQYLQEAHRINQIHVAALQAGVISLDDLDQLHRYLTLQLFQTETVNSFLFGSPQGDFRLINRMSPDDFGINTNLKPGDLPYEAGVATPEGPGLLSIYSVDSMGKLGRPIESLKVDVRNRPWYQRAAESQQPGWTEPFQIGRSDVLALSAYTPLYDQAGKLQGVFSVNLSLRRLSEFLEALSLSASGQVFIVDRQGLLIANSIGTPLYTTRPLLSPPGTPKQTADRPGLMTFSRLAALDSSDLVMKATASALRQQFGDLSEIQAAQELKLSTEGTKYFLRVMPYQDDHGLDWLIVTVVPRSDFMGAIYANMRRTALLCALALVGTTGIGIWMSRRITRSLQQLNQATQDVAAGQLDHPLYKSRIFEVANLSDSFRLMVAALQKAEQFRQSHEQILKNQVAEKTAALREAQRIARVGSWELDLETQQIIWSEELYRIYEIEPDAAIPPLVMTSQHIHPDDCNHYQRTVFEAIIARRPFDTDLRIMTCTGRVRYIQTKGQPVSDAQGNVVKFVGTVADITDRKQLEQALQASERRLKEIFDHAIAGIASMRVFLDGTWKIDQVSAGAVLISGFTGEELTQNNNLWTDRILPEDWQKMTETCFANIFAGKMATYEYRFRHKNGSLRWFSQTSNPIWDESQQCWIVTAMSVDITDRKQAEVALQHSQEQLQLVTDSVAGAISFIDKHQRYQFVNLTYEEWFNKNRIDIVGKTVHEVIGTVAYERVKHHVERALSGEKVAYEAEMPYKGGETRYISAVLVPKQTDQGVEGYYALITDISHRKQAEIKLQRSEAKFATLFHSNPAPAWIATLDEGRCLDINSSFKQFYGIPEMTVAGQKCSELGLWNSQKDHDYYFQTLRQTGQLVNFETTFRVSTGEFRTVLVSSKVNQINGQDCIIGVLNDISDRKQTELELRNVNQTLKTFLDHVPASIILFDADGRYLRVNPSLTRLVGLPAAEIVGKNFADFVSEEKNTLFKQRIQLLQETNSPIVVEDEFELEGKTKYFQSTLFPTNTQQQPQRFWSITNDITEQKKAQLTLKESEERFRRSFDNAPIGMALVDLNGRLLQVNQAICSFLGYGESELLALTVPEFSHPDDMDQDQHLFDQVLASKLDTYQLEKRYIHKQGHVVYGLLSVSLLRNVEGKPLYFICQVQDISERHKIDQMKRDFVSIVSHELRTPLTSMRGALGILSTGILQNRPEKSQHMMRVALDNTDRLIRLVNDILDLNRLESGKVHLVMEPCQVTDLMESAVGGIEAMAEAAQITLHSFPIDVTIEAAPDAIIQTLTNLLSNAIKFSPPKSQIWLAAELLDMSQPASWGEDSARELESQGVSSSVSKPNTQFIGSPLSPSSHTLIPTLPDAAIVEGTRSGNVSTFPLPPFFHFPGALLFSVRDQGRGIPQNKLDLIFERFQQVDASDSRTMGGSGLGLAICKSIVEQHGGTLWVESTPGIGSTFYFVLPGKTVCVNRS
jgi:PAS domain S-box-containing protein